MNEKLLVADIGNTQMVLDLFEGEKLMTHWRLSSERQLIADELAWQLHGMFEQSGQPANLINDIMVTSVVPHLDAPLADACHRLCSNRPPS